MVSNLHIYGSYTSDYRISSPTIQLSSKIYLSDDQRETIYHETRAMDGCYKAICLFQKFFDLVPANQKLLIQIKDEAPVLVSTGSRRVMELNVHGPKLLTILEVKGTDTAVVTGSKHDSPHVVLGFLKPGGTKVEFVVDMTRMQFGEAGRGLFGETYWMGSFDDLWDAAENVCDKMILKDTYGLVGDSGQDELLKECAERVWEKWEHRDVEGWCDYCGGKWSSRTPLYCYLFKLSFDLLFS